MVSFMICLAFLQSLAEIDLLFPFRSARETTIVALITSIMKPVSSKLLKSPSAIPYFAFMFRTRLNHALISSGSSHEALWKSNTRFERVLSSS